MQGDPGPSPDPGCSPPMGGGGWWGCSPQVAQLLGTAVFLPHVAAHLTSLDCRVPASPFLWDWWNGSRSVLMRALVPQIAVGLPPPPKTPCSISTFGFPMGHQDTAKSVLQSKDQVWCDPLVQQQGTGGAWEDGAGAGAEQGRGSWKCHEQHFVGTTHGRNDSRAGGWRMREGGVHLLAMERLKPRAVP